MQQVEASEEKSNAAARQNWKDSLKLKVYPLFTDDKTSTMREVA